MTTRHLPVRPNFDQLKRQAKELLDAVRRGDPEAQTEFSAHYPRPLDPAEARLVHAQLALARSYGVRSWLRLKLACQMTDAIWNDDAATVLKLIQDYPKLLQEDARGVTGNWGPPMSYAANVGRNNIVQMLRDRGADDVQYAFERACLQGKLDTARLLHRMGGAPIRGSIMGPCETLSGEGLALLLELGAELCDAEGDRSAPIGLILQTYCRKPQGKHRCLQILVEHGVSLPDTAPMALHQGRIDLLERLLTRNPDLLNQTFSHEEIYPLELGCSADHSLALHGTPVAGGTLLHLAVEFDEIEIANWLLEQGADVDARAALDADGFGGHTALFGCVVSQAYVANSRRDDSFARLLLDWGADTQVVASLRKRLRFVPDETERIYRDVTPLIWGRRFQNQDWINPSVMALLEERTGNA
jgi:ankyrin repeat protein